MMETTELEVEVEARPLSNKLNNLDRCDQCGAQAYVWVVMPNAEAGLLYCAHHYVRNEVKLKECAIDIFDERYKLELPEIDT